MTRDDEIAAVKGAIAGYRLRIRELERRLDGFREKCPGCRCLLLPNEECLCCKYAMPFTEEDVFS